MLSCNALVPDLEAKTTKLFVKHIDKHLQSRELHFLCPASYFCCANMQSDFSSILKLYFQSSKAMRCYNEWNCTIGLFVTLLCCMVLCIGLCGKVFACCKSNASYYYDEVESFTKFQLQFTWAIIIFHWKNPYLANFWVFYGMQENMTRWHAAIYTILE